MRLTTVIFLASLLQVSAATFGQRITINSKNIPLESVLKEIRKQTGYDIFFDSKLIPKDQQVSVTLNNATLDEAFTAAFKGLDLTYKIDRNSVSIKKAEAPSFLDRMVAAFSAIDVRGRVVSAETGEALAGATVKVKGSSKSVTTDANGDFYLQGVEQKSVVVISYVGYKVVELAATKEMGEIKLEMTSGDLQEVTINKGYYTSSKELNTGNVSKVTAAEIARQPVGDPIAALIARVPGLNIQQTSGVNGRTMIVRLRGQNSLDNGNEPLFIVDGVQYSSDPFNPSSTMFTAGGLASPFSYLNPADIESIEVFKDADATAIYGSRGANGVISITTKKATSVKLKLDARLYSGFSKAPKRLKFMNTNEYLIMRGQTFKNDGVSPSASDYDVNGTWDSTRYTDWQNYFIGGSAPVTDASVGASMGSATTSIRLGAGYRKEGTIFPGDFKSDQLGMNISANHSTLDKKFNLSFSGSYNLSQNNLPVSGVEQFIALAPNAPSIYNANKTLNWENSTWENPMAFFEKEARERARNLISNLSVSYALWKRLIFKTSMGYTTTSFDQRNLSPWTANNPELGIVVEPSSLRQHQILNNDINTYLVEPQLSFDQPLFDGKLELLVGGTYQASSGTYFSMAATGFTSDALLSSFAAGSTFSNVSRSNFDYKYNAVFARAGYTLHNKYVMNITGRRDGSSRFGPGKKFGNFGAVGAAWIFSHEDFLKNSRILTFGKIRASYGTTGNDQIGNYKYLNSYSTFRLAYQGNTSLVPLQLANRFFSWERVNKLEAGLELGFFSDRMNLEASFYRNRTNNQLVQYSLPTTTGFESVQANLPAVIQNTGLELEIRSINFRKKTFEWNTSINLTVPRNTLISLPGIETSTYAQRFVVGKPINSMHFSYQYTGLDPASGLFTFKDVNDDGGLSNLDYLPIFVGQRLYGSISNNFRVGPFELDFLFQFTKQNGPAYLYPNVPGSFNGGRGNQVVRDGSFDSQPLTQSSQDISVRGSIFTSSSGLLADASFVRLKTAGIYYTLPISKTIIRSSKLYVQGQNLVTFSNYVGFDPETPSPGINVPPLRTIAIGLQLTL